MRARRIAIRMVCLTVLAGTLSRPALSAAEVERGAGRPGDRGGNEAADEAARSGSGRAAVPIWPATPPSASRLSTKRWPRRRILPRPNGKKARCGSRANGCRSKQRSSLPRKNRGSPSIASCATNWEALFKDKPPWPIGAQAQAARQGANPLAHRDLARSEQCRGDQALGPGADRRRLGQAGQSHDPEEACQTTQRRARALDADLRAIAARAGPRQRQSTRAGCGPAAQIKDPAQIPSLVNVLSIAGRLHGLEARAFRPICCWSRCWETCRGRNRRTP